MLGGKLADVLGHRRMVMIGVTGFAVSSALCGATPTGDLGQAWLIGFRVVQGAFAALLFPAALAIVVGAYPITERGRALAVFFGISGALTALGPLAAGSRAALAGGAARVGAAAGRGERVRDPIGHRSPERPCPWAWSRPGRCSGR